MAVKNTEMRSFAKAAQSGGGLSLFWLIALPMILLPAGGFYLWNAKPELIADLLQPPSRSMLTVVPVALKSQSVEIAQGAARPVLSQELARNFPPVDMRAANEALAKGLKLATKEQPIVLMVSASGYSDSTGATTDDRWRIKKAVSPNDVFAYCTQQSEGLARSRSPVGKKFDAGAGMVMTSEVLLCGLKRGADRLCDKTQKANLVKQMTSYLDLRDGAIVALAGDKSAQMLARAALEFGTHGDIRQELRSLASRGIVAAGDFGLFMPSYIGETIGEYKSVKSACKA